jgi:hypothetical protein
MAIDSGSMRLDALPGGQQDVMAGFSDELKGCLQRATRVVLVANNLKGPLLSPRSQHVLVHGFNAPDHYFFGLPMSADLPSWLRARTPGCLAVLVGCTQPLCPMPGVSLFHERIPLPALWNYPVDRPGGKRYVGPSTGFNALVLLDTLRRQPGFTYSLVTLGFSNEAGKLWGGHAWDYERAWLLAAEITRMDLQARRPWWQFWRRR